LVGRRGALGEARPTCAGGGRARHSVRAAGVARRFVDLGDGEWKLALITRSGLGRAWFQGDALGLA